MDRGVPNLLRTMMKRLTMPEKVLSHPAPQRRKLVFEALEPRLLLSADLLVLPPPPQDMGTVAGEPFALPDANDIPEAVSAPVEQLQPNHLQPDMYSLSGDMDASFGTDWGSLLDPVIQAAAQADAVREIAFVDARLAGDMTIAGLRDGMQVFLLDPEQDGIAQITGILSGFDGLDAIHLLSHGNAGELSLGTTVLESANLADYSDTLQQWGEAMRSGGDLMLYGCNVADGARGVEFVTRLAGALGADVAASTDATGSASLGGNWNLELSAGSIEALSLTELASATEDFLLRVVNGDADNNTFAFTSSSPSTGDNFTWSDSVDGKAGSDTLSFSGFAGGVSIAVDSNGDIAATAGANSVTATAIETIAGSSGNDTLSFAAVSDAVTFTVGSGGVVTASAGTTVLETSSIENLVGGSGNDVLDLSGLSTALTFSFNAGIVTVTGSGINLSASSIESIIGGSGLNTFIFTGSDSYAGDIDGNGTLNTLDYAAYASGVTVNLATGAVAGVTGTVSNITRVVGSAHDDTLIDGGEGDTYVGGDGNDTFIFGDDLGGDTVDAGDGDDILSFSAGSSGININFTDSLGTVAADDGGSGTVNATAIETVEGSAGDDIFTAKLGETVNATLQGGAGSDRFVAETGSDFAGDVDGGTDEDILDYSSQFGNLDRSGANPNFSGAVTGIEKVQHPLTVPHGLTEITSLIQDGIDATVGSIEIPLLGNVGAEANSFISNIADGLVDRLSSALLVDLADHGTTQEIIQEWLADEFSFNFASWIPGASTASVGVGSIDSEHMEFEFVLEGVIFEDNWAIDFGGAIPGLGLSVDADVLLSLTYSLRLAFGVDWSTPDAVHFYFDTNGANDTSADDDEEISIDLSATLADGSVDDPNLQAILGFLQFDMSSYDNSDQMMQDDPGTDSPYQDDRASGIFGSFSIDLADPGSDTANAAWAEDDGRLSVMEMRDSEFHLADNLSANLSAEADVDLFARLSADVVSAGLPSIQLYLHYDQSFLEAEISFNGENQLNFGNAPTLVIEDLSLNLGTFLSNFVQPILEQVQVVTEPLQPIVDLMKSDIPILSDIDPLKNLLNKDGENGVDMLDFAGTILGGTKYASIVNAVNAMVELIDMVNSIPSEGDILINFGTYEFGGDDDNLRDSSNTVDLPDTSSYDSDSKIANSGASTETLSFLEKLQRDPVGGGFSIPILTEPAEILKLITGQTANLFFYDLPELNFDFNFRKSTPIVFPLNMILNAGFEVTVRLGFGYDSSGIEDFIAGGASDPSLIFNGFFIDDHGVEGTAGDLDEVEITSHFSVGASVGVAGLVEAGVEGGVIGNIGFDLNDVDTNGAAAGGYDGKLYFHQLDELLQAGPECFLDIHGGLDWFLEAFVWVGLDLGFFGRITLFDETFDLGSGTIIEFDHHCDVVIPPNVAHLDGSDLILHMGSAADQRDDGPASSGYSDLDGSASESFNVALSEDGSEYLVTYNGETKHFAASSINRIVVADAQDGNDVLTVGEGIAADLLFYGGAGNDKITYLGSGKAVVHGGAGDDRITVASTAHGVGGVYDSELYGEDGKDTLSSGAGNDYIDGGDGNDRIKAGAGDDRIYGGDESVAVTAGKANGDIIDAGDGNDVVYGGTGADAIKGGKGNDMIYGGDEVDDPVNPLSSGKSLGDSIEGGAGNDTIEAGSGADVVRGGDGDDSIQGGAGDDSITGGKGIDQLRGEGGNDAFYWTQGEGLDSTLDGGSGNDSIVVTGDNANTVVTLANNGANIDLAWGATTLTIAGVEKYNLNAGTGADSFTINDVSANGVKEVSIALGGAITEVTLYDYDGNGVYDDNPPQMIDGEGELLFDRSGKPVYADVYSDGTPVPYKVIKQFVADSSADSVSIYGGSGNDIFSAATAATADGSWALTMSRQNPVGGEALTTYSVAQGSVSNDHFTLNTLAGDDNVDFKDVGKDRDSGEPQFIALTLDTGADNDLLLGSQWDDALVSGSGNDRVSGNRGIDVFNDVSGDDQLIEVRDADFTINRTTLTIGSETETTISPFESVILAGGNSANTFNVSEWLGTLRMDGSDGGDTYNFWYRGSGDSVVTENDSGTTGNDTLNLYGTAGFDYFHLDANSGSSAILSDGKVQMEHGAIIGGSFVADGSYETFNYTHSEFFTMHAGAGDDILVVDDIAALSSVDIYGDQGDDTFNIGRVLEETLIDGVAVATSISNGTSTPARFYGDDGTDDFPTQPDDYYGDDYFEVNHNLAEVWLYGDAGDDTFVVNAHLTDSSPADDPAKNVFGGTGNNTISYVQNAAVNIDGGAGNDTVIVNGTGLSDTFIVTVVDEQVDDDHDPLTPDVWVLRQKVVGAGLQIAMTDIERLEVNGAGGNDFIYVFGTLPDLDVIIRGGTGNDTIVVGGPAVTVTVDPPPYNYTIPAQTIDPAPYIDHYETYSFTWGDFWYWDWNFPFYHYVAPVTYSWSVPFWVDPAPYTIAASTSTIDPPPINFTAGPKYTLNSTGAAGGTGTNAFTPGIQGKLTIDGQLDNDNIIVNNQDGSQADSGTLESYDDGHTRYRLSGLGMGSAGLTYLNTEQVTINMGAGDDQFTVDAIDPFTSVTLNLNDGNDQVSVHAMIGNLAVNGGSGNDTVTLGSAAPALSGGVVANIDGSFTFVGEAGIDALNIDDTGATADSAVAITDSTVSGLGMADGVTSYVVDTLNVRLGAHDDAIELRGTTASTYLWSNGGDDVFAISSDGTALGGSLDDVVGSIHIDGGADGNTLNISDRGDEDGDHAILTENTLAGLAPATINYTATGGRFTGGVNIWAGRGSDNISINSTRLGDVTTLFANDGDDTVVVGNLAGGPDQLLSIHGDGGADILDASAVTDGSVTILLFGDRGEESFSGDDKRLSTLSSASSVEYGIGGSDIIRGGVGNSIVIGGIGNDQVYTGDGDDVVLGDNGILTFSTGQLVTARTTDTSVATGGDDLIDAGNGRNVVLGGVGNDHIVTGNGEDVIIGDSGSARFAGTGVLVDVHSDYSRSDGNDDIDGGAGDDISFGSGGADTLRGGLGNDILVGDGGRVSFVDGKLSVVEGNSVNGGADLLLGGPGNDVIIGGPGADTMDGNLADDILIGDSARVVFANGLVNSIEFLGPVDFIMQTLFDIYGAGGADSDGTLQEVPGILAIGPNDDASRNVNDVVTPQMALSPGGVSIGFGSGQALAALPAALRNLLVDLVLVPSDSGSSGSADEFILEEADTASGAEVLGAFAAPEILAMSNPSLLTDIPAGNDETDSAAPLALAALAGVSGLQAGRGTPETQQRNSKPRDAARVPGNEEGSWSGIRTVGKPRIDWGRHVA